MSSSKFSIKSHTVPCSHIREYPRAAALSQEDQLFLAVKQYIPLSNPNPRSGDVTIIGAHANAFPKELYEPLWDDLLAQSELPSSKFRIRSIWMADIVHQGESYVLNEGKLGNDPGWFDTSRDLLHFINLYSKDMPRPIFGVGHSMGGAMLMNISLFHPRLFQGLILLDPVIQPKSAEIVAGAERASLAAMSTFRRDVWPSRDEARRAFLKSPFYQTWDKRAFERWIDVGLRTGPTVLHPDMEGAEVTLTTPSAQEVFQYLRPNYNGFGFKSGGKVDRRSHADIDPSNENSWPFYRGEPTRMFARLEELRPRVLYVIGGESVVNSQELDKIRMNRTGTGIGGSGGAVEGAVKSVTLDGVGHLVAMEDVGRTAAEAAVWLNNEMDRWHEEEEALKIWFAKDLKQKQEIDADWRNAVGGPPKRTKSSKI